ncbi:MAG: hypothetical protein ACN6N0_03010 [Microvirgula sp.]
MSKIRSLWVLCLLPLLHAPAIAAPLLLEGRVGDAPVLMELDWDAQGEVEGRYFYRKFRKDIVLAGQRNEASGELKLVEQAGREASRRQPSLVLHPAGGNRFQGRWQEHGKSRQITLAPARLPDGDRDSPYLHRLRVRSPYDFLRLADHQFSRGSHERFMGYGLQWWKDPWSGSSMFQLTDGWSEGDRKRINRLLMNRLWQSVGNYYECQLGGARSHGGEMTQKVTPRFINPAVLSLSVFSRYDCGGAHPDFADNPMTLDVASGRELDLEDILWLGRGKPVRYLRGGNGHTRDFDAFSRYRDKQFAPWVVDHFKSLYPKVMTPAAKDGECNYADPSVWQFVSWYLTPKGVYLGPSFPRVARACEYPDWSVVPYRLVNRHRGPARVRLP